MENHDANYFVIECDHEMYYRSLLHHNY